MFLHHFKMSAHPFQESPPLDWIRNDDRFSQSMARLEYFSTQGSLALVIGQTGACPEPSRRVGKSTLLRVFIQSLSKNRYRPVYLHHSGIQPAAILRLIVIELGEAPKCGKDRLFLQIIERCRKNDLTTVLLIDEAHLIDPQALTHLRLS